jgi:hypothetical protein
LIVSVKKVFFKQDLKITIGKFELYNRIRLFLDLKQNFIVFLLKKTALLIASSNEFLVNFCLFCIIRMNLSKIRLSGNFKEK